jgi:hypothetical protein
MPAIDLSTTKGKKYLFAANVDGLLKGDVGYVVVVLWGE